MIAQVLIPIVTGLVGVALGAVAFRYNSNHRARVDRMYQMHKEYNSHAMVTTRQRSLEALTTYPDLTVSEIYATDPNLGGNIWTLVAFYQRLQFGLKAKHISSRGMSDLFGRVFVYWYQLLSEREVGAIRQIERSMRELYASIESGTDEEDFREWLESAAREIDRLTEVRARRWRS